jgi:ABC-type polar amino acid transport system ATPase subunit
MAILDELDSGLDVDAVRDVAIAVEAMRHPGMGVLVITHYTRVLRTSRSCVTSCSTGTSSRAAEAPWPTAWTPRATTACGGG